MHDMNTDTLRIDVWSDVVCPWCYVGKRNLETALEELGLDIEVHWRAFELDPTAPPSTSKSMAELLSAKYGVTLEQARAMNENMTAMAASVGLTYDLENVRPGNSFDAHRLAKLAEEKGLGEEAAEALFLAYFTNNALLSDMDTLLALGVSLGLSAEDVRAVLSSEKYTDLVRSDEALAAEAGFSGVPTIVINEEFAIPGAQPPDVLVRLIGRIANGENPTS